MDGIWTRQQDRHKFTVFEQNQGLLLQTVKTGVWGERPGGTEVGPAGRPGLTWTKCWLWHIFSSVFCRYSALKISVSGWSLTYCDNTDTTTCWGFYKQFKRRRTTQRYSETKFFVCFLTTRTFLQLQYNDDNNNDQDHSQSPGGEVLRDKLWGQFGFDFSYLSETASESPPSVWLCPYSRTLTATLSSHCRRWKQPEGQKTATQSCYWTTSHTHTHTAERRRSVKPRKDALKVTERSLSLRVFVIDRGP